MTVTPRPTITASVTNAILAHSFYRRTWPSGASTGSPIIFSVFSCFTWAQILSCCYPSQTISFCKQEFCFVSRESMCSGRQSQLQVSGLRIYVTSMSRSHVRVWRVPPELLKSLRGLAALLGFAGLSIFRIPGLQLAYLNYS